MNIKEKRLLFEYVKLHELIWEITQWAGSGRQGLYRLWAYNLEDGMTVRQYDGYNWNNDGVISWEAVQGIVDRHRAGKTLDDLAKGLTRTVPNIIWS